MRLSDKVCAVDGCDREVRVHEMCKFHRSDRAICEHEGCERLVRQNGKCHIHIVEVHAPTDPLGKCHMCDATAFRWIVTAADAPGKAYMDWSFVRLVCDQHNRELNAARNDESRRNSGRTRSQQLEKKPKIQTCKGCGVDFKVENLRQQYCDISCRDRAAYNRSYDKREMARRRAARLKPKAAKTCVHCGAEYTAYKTNQKYCSVDCRDAAMHNRRRVVEDAVRAGVRESKPCIQCGKVFKPKKANNVFCTKACGSTYRSATYNARHEMDFL